jgi:hypothetical protein
MGTVSGKRQQGGEVMCGVGMYLPPGYKAEPLSLKFKLITAAILLVFVGGLGLFIYKADKETKAIIQAIREQEKRYAQKIHDDVYNPDTTKWGTGRARLVLYITEHGDSGLFGGASNSQSIALGEFANMQMCAKARVKMHEMGELTRYKNLGNVYTTCLQIDEGAQQ